MRLGHGFDETAADGPSDHEEGVIKDRAAGNEQRLTRGVLWLSARESAPSRS
jgi:hypothetical protein